MKKKWFVLKGEYLEGFIDLFQYIECSEDDLIEKYNKFTKNLELMHTECVDGVH